MQVHYNLLNGRAPDRSRALLTVAPASAKLDAAPDRAPARARRARMREGRAGEALRPERGALRPRAGSTGPSAAFAPAGLLILCRGSAANPAAERGFDVRPAHHDADDHLRRRRPHAPPRRVDQARAEPGNAAARRCCSTSRAGTSTGRTPTRSPIRSRRSPATSCGSPAGTTCASDTHGGHGVPKTPRYILWGEGTTDEMCLGILQVTRG